MNHVQNNKMMFISKPNAADGIIIHQLRFLISFLFLHSKLTNKRLACSSILLWS